MIQINSSHSGPSKGVENILLFYTPSGFFSMFKRLFLEKNLSMQEFYRVMLGRKSKFAMV